MYLYGRKKPVIKTNNMSNNIDDYPDVMLSAEVAACLRVDRATVKRWIKEGKIKAIRIGEGLGSDLRILKRDVRDYMREGIK